MRVWIFQGNPDDYDIDGYLASGVVWLVTRYAEEIAAGDRVYLWRNQGQQKAVAGIIAEAIVGTPPGVRDRQRGIGHQRQAHAHGVCRPCPGTLL